MNKKCMGLLMAAVLLSISTQASEQDESKVVSNIIPSSSSSSSTPPRNEEKPEYSFDIEKKTVTISEAENFNWVSAYRCRQYLKQNGVEVTGTKVTGVDRLIIRKSKNVFLSMTWSGVEKIIIDNASTVNEDSVKNIVTNKNSKVEVLMWDSAKRTCSRVSRSPSMIEAHLGQVNQIDCELSFCPNLEKVYIGTKALTDAKLTIDTYSLCRCPKLRELTIAIPVQSLSGQTFIDTDTTKVTLYLCAEEYAKTVGKITGKSFPEDERGFPEWRFLPWKEIKLYTPCDNTMSPT
ncbi:MAG: hypothetical protein LBP31_03220 [Holosporales bacterium]|jgi:hypothetical protein|nr:hypothetical protein [Holosporales bacterium]